MEFTVTSNIHISCRPDSREAKGGDGAHSQGPAPVTHNPPATVL